MNEMVDEPKNQPVFAQPVEVVNIDVSFGRMVILLVKLAFAAIPALIIIACVCAALAAMFAGVFAGLGHGSS